MPTPLRARRALFLITALAALVATLVVPQAAPLAAQATVPTPESVLGARPGDDFYLASYDQALAYFEQLAAASDRVRLERVGTSSFGVPWSMAIISSPQNLANLEQLREIAQRLAHPEGLSDAEARALAHRGKAIVHIDGGLHATEVAAAQHTIRLAYALATADGDPELDAILDNVVLLLWFSINPDGQNMVAHWYRDNLGTPFEVAPLPKLYQKYVGHDNNRDGYMLNTHESRVTTRVIRHFEPQILYNHHQTAPFPARIWIPPFAEPISPHVHPLMWRTVNLIGMAMDEALEERGQEGAVHMGTGFDNWYPGFIDHANNFHNIAALLTETGLYRFATPHFYTIRDFPDAKKDLRPRSLYASPWQGGWWRIGDAVDYMLTASLSVLDIAAKFKDDLLFNRYQAGRDVIAYHRANPPYAYFVPPEQRDPVAAVELLRRLAYNGIDIQRLSSPRTVEGQHYAAGTWVIPMDQPFANFVQQLFAVQAYPDLRQYPEGPPDQPYDVSGWTLPLQMGVRVIEATQPLDAATRAAFEPVHADAVDPLAGIDDASPFDSVRGSGFDSHPLAAAIRPPIRALRGNGPALAVDVAENNAFRAINRAWAQGGSVSFVPGRASDKPGAAGTPGRWLITGVDEATLHQLAIGAERVRASGQRVDRPRIGVYHPWQPSIDEGWTRWLLERYEFAFERVTNAEIIAGQLGTRLDVILIADLDPRTILEGYPQGSVPPRYSGGIGDRGARALDAFVRAGGTLVTLNHSALFALQALHLPVTNVIAKKKRSEVFLGGSIVEMQVDPSQPVMTGMPERAAVFIAQSPVFGVKEGFEGAALAHYAAAGSPLLSGYLLGEKHLRGWAAALDVHHGDGHVFLLGMRPQWRGQPFGTFKILFNALLSTRRVADAAPDNHGFWSAPPPEKDTPKKEKGEARAKP